MATIADLLIKVRADTKGAEKDIASFGGKVKSGIGKGMVPAVAVLGAAGVAAKKFADKASDLNESQNAVNVVFGKGSKIIGDFAKVADKQAGLSMQQLNELVVPLGASFRNYGDSATTAANKSVTLAKRAADMASVFNTSVPEALEAIQAGLRGEADPLEKFGVGLNAAAVQSKAMSMGLAKTAAELTNADMAQARYALILDQTSRFQGDFVRTSDQAANAARINAAQQENLEASLGKGLLPAYKTIVTIIGQATQFMAEHQSAVKVAAVAITGLAAAVVSINLAMKVYEAGAIAVRAATAAWTAAQWLLNAALNANPIGIVILALVALGAALVVLWTKSETFRNIVTGTWNAIKATTVTVWDFIRDHLKAIMAALLIVLTGGLGALVVLAVAKWDAIKSGTSAAWGAIKGAVSGAVSAVRSAISGGFDAAENAASSAVNRIESTVKRVFGALGGIVKGAVGAVRSGAAALAGAFSPITGALEDIIGVAERAIGMLQSVADKVSSVGGIVGKAKGLLGHIPGFATGVRNFGGGLAVVGERGPELVNLPRGADVFTNAESRKMLGGGVTIQGDLVVREEADVYRVAAQIGRRAAVAGL